MNCKLQTLICKLKVQTWPTTQKYVKSKVTIDDLNIRDNASNLSELGVSTDITVTCDYTNCVNCNTCLLVTVQDKTVGAFQLSELNIDCFPPITTCKTHHVISSQQIRCQDLASCHGHPPLNGLVVVCL